MQPQLCPDMARLTRGEFDWSGGGLASLKVIQRELLTEFWGENVSFLSLLHKLSNDWLKCVLAQSGFCGKISVEGNNQYLRCFA